VRTCGQRGRLQLESWRSLGLEAGIPRQPGRHSLLGAIALAEGCPRDAIREFWAWDEDTGIVIQAQPHLARAYEQVGEPDSAIALYERYIETPWTPHLQRGVHDALCLAQSCERLGQLYQQRSDTAKAIYYYDKLVELWKDADPELQPRVEAARWAIEALSPDR
jgi:tetratricopeptide (TPR) repeat protein